MVAGNIQERIKKMKEAILTEAKQRAHSIVENANEQADQERAKIYNVQKQKIQAQFLLKQKNEKIKEKIYKSALHNKHRIQRMQVRYQLVEKLRSEVNNQLTKSILNKQIYTKLTKQLIVQGMLRMMERNLEVQLKKQHISMAQSLFSQCQNLFSDIMERETNIKMESKLSLSKYCLEDKNKFIIGGLYLRSNDGVIVCDNSLDSRVSLCFEQLLPVIRQCLFPPKEIKHIQNSHH